MSNVWCVPSNDRRSMDATVGFDQVQVVDITTTTVDEQRSTEWMHFGSLSGCLDDRDPSRTIEGHPAPVRAIFMGLRSS